MRQRAKKHLQNVLELDAQAKKKAAALAGSPVLTGSPFTPKVFPSPFIADLDKIDGGCYSQEDLVIVRILECIGVKNNFCVEFGAVDGASSSNVRLLLNSGWKGLQMDRNVRELGPYWKEVVACHISPDNVNKRFAEHKVPQDLDVCVIDVDGHDYWIWLALTWKPRIMMIETNLQFGLDYNKVRRYKADERKDHNDESCYWGASAGAMMALAKSKGYSLVHVRNMNMFFVLSDLLHKNDLRIPPDQVYSKHKHPYRRVKGISKHWVDAPSFSE